MTGRLTTGMASARGVIFDLDGTLADTLRDLTDALNWGLARQDLAKAAPEQVRGWVGDGLVMLIRRAVPGARQETLAKVAADVAGHYRAHCMDYTRAYPGIESMLAALSARGVKTAVLSNKPHEFTVQMVEGLFGRGRFDVVRGSAAEADRKPHPGLALEIARQWNLPPSQVAIVGDMKVDIATARSAGMRAIAVCWGFHDRPELQAAGPDALVDCPADLLAVLLPS